MNSLLLILTLILSTSPDPDPAVGTTPPPISIDQAWMAARPGPPYALDKLNGYYRLEADIDSERSGLVYTAQNISLDFNGHSITYGNTPPISFSNPDFADGLDGWDIKEAGQSILTPGPNTQFFVVPTQLKWTTLSEANQRIFSPKIQIPEAGVTYTVSMCSSKYRLGDVNPSNGAMTNRSGRFRLDPYDAETGLPIQVFHGHLASLEQGEGAATTFCPNQEQADHGIKIGVTFQPNPGTGTAGFAISRLRITRSMNYGILAMYSGSSSSLNGNYPINFQGTSTAFGTLNLTPAILKGFNKGGNGRIFDSTAAEAKASIADGKVTAITVTKNGSGFTKAPKVLVSTPGAYRDRDGKLQEGRQATVEAVLGSDGEVESISITDAGEGYTEPPGVFIEPRARIIQGRGNGAYCNAVHAANAVGLEVGNVAISLNGDDCTGVWALRQGTAYHTADTKKWIHDSSVSWPESGPDTTVREANVGGFNTQNAANSVIERCLINYSPHQGIAAGSSTPGTDGSMPSTVIRWCHVFPKIVHTNGYALRLGGNNMDVRYNDIEGLARGIYYEGDAGLIYSGASFIGNHVDLMERANREYGTGGGSIPARSFRLRNLPTDSALRDVNVRFNVGIARTRAGDWMDSAIGFKAHLRNFNGRMNDAGWMIADNIFVGVAEGENIDGLHASGFALDAIDPGINPKFERNTFASNLFGGNVSWSDSSKADVVSDLWFTGNTFRKLPGPKPYYTVQIGFYGAKVGPVSFVDSLVDGGALSLSTSGAILWRGTSVKQITVSDPIPAQRITGYSGTGLNMTKQTTVVLDGVVVPQVQQATPGRGPAR